jgi:hypothetical protein
MTKLGRKLFLQLSAFIRGDINSNKRPRNMYLETNMIFCNRYLFAIQIITALMHILLWILNSLTTVIFVFYLCDSNKILIYLLLYFSLFNPLKTNGRRLYLRTQSVPRCKHFSSRSLMSHRACCHTCYTIQLMHYSHFKTHSLQHLKPIKC